MKKSKLGTQIFVTSFLISIFALIIVTWYASSLGRQFFIAETGESLRNQASFIYDILLEDQQPFDSAHLQSVLGKRFKTITIRTTIIESDGNVLADSEEDPRQMENHKSRPEIIQAREEGIGKAIRFSHTVKRNMMYIALRFSNPDGTVFFVRTSKNLSDIEKTISAIQVRIGISGLIMAFIALLIGFFVSRRITNPLEEIILGVKRISDGDFSIHLPKSKTREMALLSASLNEMTRQIDDKLQTIVRQKNEQKAVFESMLEGVVAVDTAGRIISINTAAYRLLKIDKKNVRGENIEKVIPDRQIVEFFKIVLEKGEALEDEITMDNSAEQCLKLNARSLRDDPGNTIGALMVLNDVTRLRQLEMVRKEFVSNVSHELRTPLTSIKGFAEALKDGAIDDKENASRFVDIIYRQTERLSLILEDILSLSKLDRDGEGETQIELYDDNLCDVIEAAIQTCSINAEKKNIRIDMECAAPCVARINSALLEEALTNLIDNAVKYSPEKSAVTVQCIKEKDHYILSVKDQGNGIASEHLPRIFERFYRVDKARSRKLGGTGLGLAIVKHIAHVHGGSVAVQSEIGQGSVFKIILPVTHSAE